LGPLNHIHTNFPFWLQFYISICFIFCKSGTLKFVKDEVLFTWWKNHRLQKLTL
jgi:hypothetical protein